MNTRLAIYQAKRADSAFDDYEIAADLEPDEGKLMRQRLPRDVVRQKQEAREQAELAAMQQGGGGAEAPALPPALAGRALGGAA